MTAGRRLAPAHVRSVLAFPEPGAPSHQTLRIGSLQWALGGFSATIGALMLVVPYQFVSPAYAPLRPHLVWWGPGLLLAASGMFAVATLAPRFRFVVLVHVWAAGMLLSLAAGFAVSGSWSGTTNYAVLGLGTLLAPLLAGRRTSPGWLPGEFLSLLLGVGALLTGLLLVLVPDQFRASTYDPIRAYLAWYGLAFTVSGLLLCLSHTRPFLRSGFGRWVPVLLAGVFFAFGNAVALPNHIWTGVAYYVGFGVFLVAQACVGTQVRQFDPGSLRTRLALILAAAAAVPLLVLVPLYAHEAENQALSDALARQQVLAGPPAQGSVVEPPSASSLAAIHGKLDVLFGGLVAAVLAAAGFGVVAAGWLSRPLATLGAAVEALAAGDDSSPLPVGGLTEIAGLAVAFGTMRERVIAHAAGLLAANRELEAVYRVGQIITAPLQLDVVLNTIARCTVDVLASDSGAILLVDQATQTLSVQGAYGLSEASIRGTRDRVGESIAGRVVRTGKPLIANDLPNNQLFVNPAAEQEHLLAIASVPLIVADTIIGTLDVHSRTNRFAFDTHHIHVLQMLASQAAIAIENARLYQELVAARDELQRSNRELQDFASIASHDLQEPLRKVQAFGNRLNQKCYDQLGEEGRLYVDRMQNAASRMQTLVTDLLAFSRVTAQSLPFVELDLNVLLTDVLSDLEVTVEQAGAEVEVRPLPTVLADPTQMRQLFQNLLSNGLKFRRPDVAPRLRVASRSLESNATARVAADWYEISVSDNGIGFDEKYLDRIFTIFQRLHGRAEYEGTGVGLAVCRKIVERHGGTITARSTLHEGSTFLLTLPTTQSADGALRAA